MLWITEDYLHIKQFSMPTSAGADHRAWRRPVLHRARTAADPDGCAAAVLDVARA